MNKEEIQALLDGMTKEELTKLLEFVRALIYDKDKAAEMIRKMEAMEIDN